MNLKLIVSGLLLLGLSTANSYAASDSAETSVISIKASRFMFSPNQITIKNGQTVVLELEATDRQHGFSIPELGVSEDLTPGEKKTIKITPSKSGKFVFYCDIFCGSGHEQMAGEILVEN